MTTIIQITTLTTTRNNTKNRHELDRITYYNLTTTDYNLLEDFKK